MLICRYFRGGGIFTGDFSWECYNSHHMRAVLFILLAMTSVSAESVKSITGNILLDINSDETSELHLNSTGLAIGQGLAPSANLHLQGNGIVTGEMVIGNTAGNSTLELSGSLGYQIQSVSDNITLSGNSIAIADTSTGNVTVTLPYAGNVMGRKYTIKKSSESNILWVAGGGNAIDDLGSVEMTSSGNGYPYLSVVSDGSQWRILNQSSGIGALGSDNLVGWWKFDEASGTTASDSSGQGNNGTLYGMAGTEWVSGKFGNAIELDGVDDYIRVPDSSDYESNHLTYSAWVYSDIVGTNIDGQTFINKGDNPWSVILTVGGQKPNFHHHGPNVWLSGTSINLNEWVHVVASYDGSNSKIYVNGVLNASASDTTDTSYDSVDLYIGTRAGGNTNIFNGKIDDVRIYNKALSASEVAALYGDEIPWTPAQLNTTLWIDASDTSTLTTTGSDVDIIADKSANGYDIYDKNGSKPDTGANTINGLNVLTFNSNGMHRQGVNDEPAITIDTNFFLVIQEDGSNTQGQLFLSQPSENNLTGANGGTVQFKTKDSGGTVHTASSGFSIDQDATTMIDLSRVLADNKVYFNKNGGTTSSNDTLGATNLHAVTAEAQLFNYYGSNYWTGLLCEFIIVNGTMTTADKEKVQGYLAHKWGITLPSGHTYENSPP